jgi:uncharacterized membrane protein YkvA (DUF1232 family)
MAKTLKRAGAFSALARQLMRGARGGPSLSKRISALPRMLRASAKGEYDGGWRVAAMAAATVYVVSPFDFVPEAMLLIVGLADDAVMVTWLAGALLAETERFLEWERERNRVVVG